MLRVKTVQKQQPTTDVNCNMLWLHLHETTEPCPSPGCMPQACWHSRLAPSEFQFRCSLLASFNVIFLIQCASLASNTNTNDASPETAPGLLQRIIPLTAATCTCIRQRGLSQVRCIQGCPRQIEAVSGGCWDGVFEIVLNRFLVIHLNGDEHFPDAESSPEKDILQFGSQLMSPLNGSPFRAARTDSLLARWRERCLSQSSIPNCQYAGYMLKPGLLS